MSVLYGKRGAFLKNMEKSLILVSDWEKVEKDDYYLSDEWAKKNEITNIKQIRQLQAEDKLYLSYIVDATDYAVYRQMDSDLVFIDNDGEVMLYCETAIIGNNHYYRRKLDE